jgi:metal-responsive CopG/Arc/MetJ family transcriptional regulator
MKKRIQITVDEDLLEKLDDKRGLIPRATYINNLIKKDVMLK